MPIIRVPMRVYSPTFIIRNNVTNAVMQRVVSNWTETYFNNVLAAANGIWLTAQIEFVKQSFSSSDEIELPGGHGAGALTIDDQAYLCSQLQAATGVNVILVNRAASSDPAASGNGGSAIESYRACVLARALSQQREGIFLAHELGHLLSLHHSPGGLGDSLMFAGLSYDTQLNRDERQRAYRHAQLLIQPRTASQ